MTTKAQCLVGVITLLLIPALSIADESTVRPADQRDESPVTEQSRVTDEKRDTSYRVAATVLLDRDDVKFVKIRIECDFVFSGKVDRRQSPPKQGRAQTGSGSSFDQRSKCHYVEIVLLIDHIASHQCVKHLLNISAEGRSAGAPNVRSVPAGYKLDDHFKIGRIDGTYELDQTVELLTWEDWAYTLTIDPWNGP